MNNDWATNEAKAIASEFSNTDGSTNWDKLEAGTDGVYFSFTNESKASAGQIEIERGEYAAVAWRLATPSRRQRRVISREQAVELMAKITADTSNRITFRGSL